MNAERPSTRPAVLAAAVLALAVLALAAGFRLDRSFAKDSSGMWDFIHGEAAKSEPPPVAPRPAEEPRAASPRPAAADNGLARRAVCVRLCDGYFFPVGNIASGSGLAGQENLCAGLCPGAPTRVFVLAAGTDKIDQAVSKDGAAYSALPVAFQHTVKENASCTCAVGSAARLVSLMQDFTLRRGDAVMTPSGIKIFKGSGGHWPYQESDFQTLAEARVSERNSVALATIESAVLMPQGTAASAAIPPGSAASAASATASAAPAATAPAKPGVEPKAAETASGPTPAVDGAQVRRIPIAPTAAR